MMKIMRILTLNTIEDEDNLKYKSSSHMPFISLMMTISMEVGAVKMSMKIVETHIHCLVVLIILTEVMCVGMLGLVDIIG